MKLLLHFKQFVYCYSTVNCAILIYLQCLYFTYLSFYITFIYYFHRGFESETDTEEYEKIGQMSIDKKPTQQSICVGTTQPEYCDMATNMSIVLKRDIEMVTDVSLCFVYFIFHRVF